MTITDEMVERAARALRLQARINFKISDSFDWDTIDEPMRAHYRSEARAALEAALSENEG